MSSEEEAVDLSAEKVVFIYSSVHLLEHARKRAKLPRPTVAKSGLSIPDGVPSLPLPCLKCIRGGCRWVLFKGASPMSVVVIDRGRYLKPNQTSKRIPILMRNSVLGQIS